MKKIKKTFFLNKNKTLNLETISGNIKMEKKTEKKYDVRNTQHLTVINAEKNENVKKLSWVLAWDCSLMYSDNG